VLAVYGGFNACTDGVGKAWISTLLPAGAQGTGQGLYQGLTGVAVLIAGVWAGLAWHGTGRLPLLVCGAIAALIGVPVRNVSPAANEHDGAGQTEKSPMTSS